MNTSVVIGLLIACLVVAVMCLGLTLYLLVTLRRGSDANQRQDEDRAPGELDPQAELLPAQYAQCYEHLRHHDRVILQAPSIAMVIDGAVLISTFAFVPIWWVREIILLGALIITLGFINLLVKTLYHIRVEKQTLTLMETQMAQRVISRTTKPENVAQYWHYIPPKHLQRFSAAEIFIGFMWLIVGLIIVLLILNPVLLREALTSLTSTSSLIPTCLHIIC